VIRVVDVVDAEGLPPVEPMKPKRGTGTSVPGPKLWMHHPDCRLGKRGYFAKKKLREFLSRNEQHTGHRPRIYRCPDCNLWHHTSMTYQEQQDMLARQHVREATSKETSMLTTETTEEMSTTIADLISDDVSTSIVTITPETAQRLLDHNDGNRKITDANVKKLVRAMRNGEWTVNGEAIKISMTGRLIDGQHRLSACIEAEKPFQTLVVYGLQDEAQVTMDGGKVRSLSDHLSQKGVTDSNNVAAAARAFIVANRYGLKVAAQTAGGMTQVTNPEGVAYAMANLDEIKHCVSVGSKALGLGVTKRIGALAYREFAALDFDDAEDFFDRLREGSGLEADHPVLTLRNTLNSIQLSPNRHLTNAEVLAYMIKAWNRYRKGETLKVLSFRAGGANPEKFPVAI
jgi:hypothetical protein